MINGTKALVTGGSRGIGFSIAKALIENGCSVVITGRKEDTLKAAAAALGKGAYALVWDSENIEKSDELIEKSAEILGGLDIVVNNAGIFAMSNEWNKDGLLNTTVEQWEKVMKINSSAVFFTMQSAVKYMRKNGIKGNILNISSVAGYEPVRGAYGASKISAVGLTRGWGLMFADEGITINGIAPGPVATEMNNWHEGDSMKNDRIPYGRFSTADEIASLAVSLLSRDSKMICGETVIMDGAYSIR